MTEKTFSTRFGRITYWLGDFQSDRQTLVFLPGLTADHTLFDRQLAYFSGRYNCMVWDAPGHGASRPFTLDFTLDDKARFLRDILKAEQIERPVVIGQSMGGYVAQTLLELYPESLGGFVSVDSCPLQKKYASGLMIWSLKNAQALYDCYPWRRLLRDGANGCAVSEYGRRLMRAMMEQYSKKEYCALAGHGYRMLAQAYASDRAYRITCPVLLLCGEKDKAGAAKRYNKRWSRETGIPVHWIENAGHNSNTDQSEQVNRLIEEFVGSLQAPDGR